MDKYKYFYIDEKGIYCYKDSDVLINKLNIKNQERLHEAERAYTSARQAQLNKAPIKGNYDFDHLKAIHKYLFQDIYFWAGNGRAQREFIRYIGSLNGYGFDWSKVSSDENIVASYESVNGDNAKLKELLSKIIYTL